MVAAERRSAAALRSNPALPRASRTAAPQSKKAVLGRLLSGQLHSGRTGSVLNPLRPMLLNPFQVKARRAPARACLYAP